MRFNNFIEDNFTRIILLQKRTKKHRLVYEFVTDKHLNFHVTREPYRHVKVIKVWDHELDNHLQQEEERKILALMHLLGISRVVNSKFSLDKMTPREVFHRMGFLLDKCWVCGSKEHFSN